MQFDQKGWYVCYVFEIYDQTTFFCHLFFTSYQSWNEIYSVKIFTKEGCVVSARVVPCLSVMNGWYFTKSIQTFRMWLEKHISIASRPLTLNRHTWSHLTHSRINFHPSSWLLFYLRSGTFKEYYVLFYLILITCYHQCPLIDDNILLSEVKFRLIVLFEKKRVLYEIKF